MKRKVFDPKEPRRAKDAGVFFFTLPGKLRPSAVDRLLRKTVRLINSSGWAWTTECCQGHPDFDGTKKRGDRGWSKYWKGCGGGANPILRVVVRKERVGPLMWALAEALHSIQERCSDRDHKDHFGGTTPQLMLQLKYPFRKTGYAWRQVVLVIPSEDVSERNAGCKTFEEFALLIHEMGKEWGVAKR